ncbi:MAG: HIT family protein [Acidimicrobiales bacterium]
MSLDHLWAGWRSAYVSWVSDADGPPPGPPEGAGAGPGSAHGLDAEPRHDGPDGSAGWRALGGPAEGAGVAEDPGGEALCVFCRIFSSGVPDEERFVVWEGRSSVVLLNAFPYASGHVLVMPRRHVAELWELEAEESSELWESTRRAVQALQAAYSPDGCNLGANLGRAAGAGIPRHVHLHALPRWVGDTNFMTSVASTRVLPEALPDSWAKLRAAWPR